MIQICFDNSKCTLWLICVLLNFSGLHQYGMLFLDKETNDIEFIEKYDDSISYGHCLVNHNVMKLGHLSDVALEVMARMHENKVSKLAISKGGFGNTSTLGSPKKKKAIRMLNAKNALSQTLLEKRVVSSTSQSEPYSYTLCFIDQLVMQEKKSNALHELYYPNLIREITKFGSVYAHLMNHPDTQSRRSTVIWYVCFRTE